MQVSCPQPTEARNISISDRARRPTFIRPVPPYSLIAPFAREASRLERYRPPFRFSSFFSPEDTLLCVLAGERALAARVGNNSSIVELTSGSGLVGFQLLNLAPGARLFGVDVDPDAEICARANARLLDCASRARFSCMSLWDGRMESVLRAERADLLVCNPPYVPERPGAALPLEAGAGADGSAHLRRVVALAKATQPEGLVLSWCSLCDPEGVVGEAEDAGYQLDELFVVVIADGEYSGSVHDYLVTLPTSFLNSANETLVAVAPDGSARFAYLLMSGAFTRIGMVSHGGRECVRSLCADFAERGTGALVGFQGAIKNRIWLLDRWDEIALRAELHGSVDAPLHSISP
ncbi:MAG: methyltransferase [Gemmatimonadaceae bacterium]